VYIQNENANLENRLSNIATVSSVSPHVVTGNNEHKRLMSFLDRAGPVSLNTISRKKEYQDIAKKN